MKYIVLGVLAFCGLIAALVISAEATGALLFGWYAFLSRVLPEMSVHWPSVAVGGVAVALFAAGVHWVGWTSRRQAEAAEELGGYRWRGRWSLSILALVTVLFASGIGLVGVVHQTGWLISADGPLSGESLIEQGGQPGYNLKSIGLGMESYHSSYKKFPQGGTFDKQGRMLHSWETHLLPFLSYDYSAIDLKLPWDHPRNTGHFHGVVPEFINPGIRTPELRDGQGYGLSHYAANVHVLSGNKTMRLDEIKDGTSTTLLLGEVNTRFQPWGHPVNWRDPGAGINRSPYGFGGPWGTGGAQFVMADGSVRFVSERVSPAVLRSLSTPNGGESIDETVLEPAR